MNKLSALPILIFISLVEPLQAIAQQPQQQPAPLPPQGYYMHGPWHMWGDGYGWSFWWMFPMMLFMLFVFGIIFFFACRSFSHGMHHWGPPSRMTDRPWGDPTHSALQILNERFARGEIQKDEYAERKAAILAGGQR